MDKIRSLPRAFGRVLKEARTNAGLSQALLSKKTRLDRTFISLLELGKRQPTITTMFKLCEVLKIDPEVFIQRMRK